ncbi:MAG: PA14 domain-containing protein [Patescibacteria group bacterium]
MKKIHLYSFFPLVFITSIFNLFPNWVRYKKPKLPSWPRVTPTLAPTATPSVPQPTIAPTTKPTAAPTATPTPEPTPSYSGYKGEYFANQNLSGEAVLVRDDQAINFVWNHDAPDDKVPTDQFSVRWNKTIATDQGNYEFMVTADDGVRLFVDDQLVIDKWFDQKSSEHKVIKNLSAGDHTIVMEYYEAFGGAVAKFTYNKAEAATVTPAPTTEPTLAPTPLPTGQPTTQPTLTPAPTVPPVSSGSWEIQSVSSMKESKDRICDQRNQTFIDSWAAKAKELGANYVAVETPYDSPACGSSVDYTNKWVSAIRSQGLSVWHRHMPLAFEGIYDTPKQKGDYFAMITSYIKNNKDMFREGDIFTPIPEPQNGGISGISHCAFGVCVFDNREQFNKWLRDAIDVSENAFKEIGLGGKMKIGYYGFDGFIAWGSNNPDWNGILEDATIQKMGNLAIDHYPELIGQTMEQGLREVMDRYPGVPIILSEWGSTGNTNLEQQVLDSMGAAKRMGVAGFNYWHMGMGGNEALVNEDFSHRSQFDEVQSFFKGTR